MKLIPSQVSRFGEPWRVSSVGALVTDEPDGRFDAGDRASYGGNLVAESIDRRRAERAAECVNFCAGFWFPPGAAYGNGLVDLVDLFERLHHRLFDDQGEIRGRYVGLTDPDEREYAREEFRLYSDSYAVLRRLGRPL